MRNFLMSAAVIGQLCFFFLLQGPVWGQNGKSPAGHRKDIWPGFRGFGNSISPVNDLPVKWSAKNNLIWKVDLPGYGQSSPVVYKDKVFVTAVDGKEREIGYVLAYHTKSGKELWRHTFSPTFKAAWTNYISKAAPTPVVDAKAVYTFFEGGEVLAFSHDGKLLWLRSLVKDYGFFQNGHGLGSSLAQTDKAVIVLVDDEGPSYLLALDKKTGKNLWKTDRKKRVSWTSPVVVRRKGKEEIIISSNGSVSAYNAENGELLWEHEGVTGNTVPSPSVFGDLVVIGATLGRSGGDPKASIRSNCCFKRMQKDGKVNYRLLWSAKKATSSFGSPLLYRGNAYFVSRIGVVYCLDAKTGEERFNFRLEGSCWASPIGAGEYIYFFGKKGQTTVIKTGPKLEAVAKNSLFESPKAKTSAGGLGNRFSGPILYGVAATNKGFFLRTGTALYRVNRQ